MIEGMTKEDFVIHWGTTTSKESQLLLERLLLGEITLKSARRRRERALQSGDIRKWNREQIAIKMYEVYLTLR